MCKKNPVIKFLDLGLLDKMVSYLSKELKLVTLK